jgi:hypothetical protein
MMRFVAHKQYQMYGSSYGMNLSEKSKYPPFA